MKKHEYAVDFYDKSVMSLIAQYEAMLIDRVEFVYQIEQLYQQANKMFEQQIIDANYDGQRLHAKSVTNLMLQDNAESYYNETYGSKGSDETKYYEQSRGINIDSFQSEAQKKQDYIVKVTDVTSSQTEISDEEIEKASENAWSDYEYEEGNLYSTTFKGGWKLAIEWYREQLKQRQ